MKIIDLYKKGGVVLSLEIFPPKLDYSLETIFRTINELKKLKPGFISVTYGAGGSSRVRTVEIASRIKKEYGIEALAHLTCASHSRKEMNEILNDLLREDIDNILALRGDPPLDKPEFDFSRWEYRYAYELIIETRNKADFGIAAAAYPEGHSECERLSSDLVYLKQKVDAGVDFLITQMFFDNRIYYEFLDKARAAGINCPIVPGIMPVLNPKQIRRIIYLGVSSISSKMLRLVDKYEHNPTDMGKAGMDFATEQVIDLVNNQVPGIHLYTMNKSEQVTKIAKDAGLA